MAAAAGAHVDAYGGLTVVIVVAFVYHVLFFTVNTFLHICIFTAKV